MSPSPHATILTDNASERRYEMPTAAGLAFVAYTLDGPRIMLDHAEVPPALEGQGVGSALVKATLDAVRARDLKVVARCGFVRAYLRRHPEYKDLVA